MSNYNSIPDPINGWGAVFPANMPITIPTEFSQCATYMQQILYLMAYKQPKLINGANVSITDNPDGTQTISVAGEAEGIVTLHVNPAITLPAGSEPRVENVGTNSNVILQFYLPEGMTGERGETGADAEVKVGTVITVPSTSPASVTNTGTPGHAVLNFSIPRGADGSNGSNGAAGENATIAIGATLTGEPGTEASVRNVGTPTNAILSFTIPEGRPGRDGSNGRDGADGVNGTAATITVGTVTTLPAGSQATVTNVGTPQNAVLDIGLPVGNTGETGATGAPGEPGRDGSNGSDGAPGENATITIGTVTSLPAGSTPTVTNTGTETAAVLNFGIPKGADGADGEGIAATIQIGTVTTLPAGSPATVINAGTEQRAVLNFGLPAGTNGSNGRDGTDGVNGTSATVTVGSVTTLPAGSQATVTNVGTTQNAVLDFGLPVGATGNTGATGAPGADGRDGADGLDGASASVSVGTVTDLPAGSIPTVTNVGTPQNCVLNFGIPAGQTGAQGEQGPVGPMRSDLIVCENNIFAGYIVESEDPYSEPYFENVTAAGTLGSYNLVDFRFDNDYVMYRSSDATAKSHPIVHGSAVLQMPSNITSIPAHTTESLSFIIPVKKIVYTGQYVESPFELTSDDVDLFYKSLICQARYAYQATLNRYTAFYLPVNISLSADRSSLTVKVTIYNETEKTFSTGVRPLININF